MRSQFDPNLLYKSFWGRIEKVLLRYTLCCDVTSIAKSHWQGRPADDIKVSSRSNTSVMGERLEAAEGILEAIST